MLPICPSFSLVTNRSPALIFIFALFVLATSYSCLATTIASGGLNCRVRNENGCGPSDKSPGQKEQLFSAGMNGSAKSFFLQKKLLAMPRADALRPCGAARTRASPLRQTTRTELSKIPFVETKSDKKDSKTIRDSHNSFREFCRRISTPRLHALLRFHLVPINVVISHEPQTISDLGVGFPLRCFQRLSFPDIATGRCTWWYSPQTRGQFIRVLSYY